MLANDDIGVGPTDVTDVTDPANGTVSINDGGTPNDPTDDVITYIPDPDYNGPDSFNYTVCNSMGDCSTATVNITVNPIVDAIDDSIATIEDAPITIDILSNEKKNSSNP